MRELSLFSGAGGGILASLLLGHEIIGAVDNNEYCCRVLEQRQRDGILKPFPIFQIDIRDFIRLGYAELYKGRCDIVSGGFPCQPYSVAGKQLGADDPRDMWPATLEVLQIIRPRKAYLENVPGLLGSGYFAEILEGLAEMGMSVRWGCLGGADVGATCDGLRLWVLAEANDAGRQGSIWQGQPDQAREEWKIARCELMRPDCGPWPPGPRAVGQIARMADGVAHRVERLRAIGNGQNPIVAATAWRILSGE